MGEYGRIRRHADVYNACCGKVSFGDMISYDFCEMYYTFLVNIDMACGPRNKISLYQQRN